VYLTPGQPSITLIIIAHEEAIKVARKKWTERGLGGQIQVVFFNKRLSLSQKTAYLQIAEISFSLGFDNPTYFSRLFKKEVGVPPNVFRDQYLN
jgi:AraC-like DNA-binding protein